MICGGNLSRYARIFKETEAAEWGEFSNAGELCGVLSGPRVGVLGCGQVGATVQGWLPQ